MSKKAISLTCSVHPTPIKRQPDIRQSLDSAEPAPSMRDIGQQLSKVYGTTGSDSFHDLIENCVGGRSDNVNRVRS